MAQTICGWWILWGRRESLVGERWTWRTGKSLGEYCELVGFYYHRSIKAEDEKYYDRIMNEFDIFWAQRQRSTSVNILKQKISVTNRISRKWTIERSYVVLVLTRFKQCILWWTQLLILQLSWVECVRSSRWPWPTNALRFVLCNCHRDIWARWMISMPWTSMRNAHMHCAVQCIER